MLNEKDALNTNRESWNRLVPIHLSSDFYSVDAFKGGATSLKSPEIDLIGNSQGLKMLHLQCHFGLDTISWERAGASVTGVDFSTVAIETAKELAANVDSQAVFYCRDVHDLPVYGQFDIVISTYGVMCWIANLKKWADGIYKNLRQGGKFVIVDFHPILEVIYPGKMTGTGRYFPLHGLTETKTVGTYADRKADICYSEFRWQHPVSHVVNALLSVGLRLLDIQEYPFSSYRIFDDLIEREDGMWSPHENGTDIPYMYSLVLERP